MVAGRKVFAGDDGLLYLALSQFPIYLSPQLLKPVVRERSARKRRFGDARA